MKRARQRTTRAHPERTLHKSVAEYLSLALPRDAYWFPCPNASKRAAAQAANMKRAGEFRAGVPDIFIIYKGRTIGIELKAGKGRLTASQRDAHEALTLAGAVVGVVRSLDELQEFLALLVKLRAQT